MVINLVLFKKRRSLNHLLSKTSYFRTNIWLRSESRSRSMMRYLKEISGTKENLIMPSLIDRNTTEVPIDTNAS